MSKLHQIFLLLPLHGSGVLWWSCLCLCVCLSVRDHISGSTRPVFTKFFVHVCMLLMDMVRSSTGGVAICYALPVLWMTSYLHMSQWYCTSLPAEVLKVTPQVAAPGTESVVYDCLLVYVTYGRGSIFRWRCCDTLMYFRFYRWRHVCSNLHINNGREQTTRIRRLLEVTQQDSTDMTPWYIFAVTIFSKLFKVGAWPP